MLRGFGQKHGNVLYFIFRILIGFMFFQHGAQKAFGLLGGQMQGLGSLMWFVGLIEFLVGLGVLFGLFTRLSALGGAVVMIAAYIKAHVPNGILPLNNGGELALVYLAAFLVLLGFGARKWSLERKLFKKEHW